MELNAEYVSAIKRFAQAAERLAAAMSDVARAPNDETAIGELIAAAIAYRDAQTEGREASTLHEAMTTRKTPRH